MELEKLLRSLLYRLESIDDESKSTIIEDEVNKLSHQIGQLKSDLSDVASLFHLLKDNKERLTMQKSPSWEVLRILSAKRNYNITHQEGDNEIIADNKNFYNKKNPNNK